MCLVCLYVVRCFPFPVSIAQVLASHTQLFANMSSRPKKKKLSSSEKRKMQQEKGKSGAQKRGLGVSGRLDFELPANWRTEEVPSTSKTSLHFISPGKKRYRSQASAKAAIKERGMNLCLNEASDDSEPQDSQSDFEGSPKKIVSKVKSEQQIEHRLFVCQSSQFEKLIDDINKTSKCSTQDCNGKFFSPLFRCRA